jgi:hypothetical protein
MKDFLLESGRFPEVAISYAPSLVMAIEIESGVNRQQSAASVQGPANPIFGNDRPELACNDFPPGPPRCDGKASCRNWLTVFSC